MDLVFEWQRATKPRHIQAEVERIMTERMLELYGSAEEAYKSKEQWHRMGEPVLHPWNTYFRIAYIDATKSLDPSDHPVRFRPRFDMDGQS